jgi:chromosome segregation ATPase
MTTPDSQIKKDVPPGEPPQQPPDDLRFVVRGQAREIAALKKELAHENRMHREADELYCATNGRASFLDEAIEAKEELIQALTNEKNSFACNLSVTRTTLSTAQQTIVARDERITNLTVEKGNLEQKLTETNTKLDTANQTIRTKGEEITTLTDTNRGLEQQLRETNTKLSTANQTIRTKGEQLSETNTKLDTAIKTIRTKGEEITTLTTDGARWRVGVIIFGLAVAAYFGLHAFGVLP